VRIFIKVLAMCVCIVFITEAFSSEYPQIIFDEAHRYDFGYDGKPERPKKAFDLYLQAAKMNHPGAQLRVGLFLLEGRGVKKNVEDAIKWLQKSACQGVPLAGIELATIYYEGKVIKKDNIKAYMWYRFTIDRLEGDLRTFNIILAKELYQKITNEITIEEKEKATTMRPNCSEK